MKTNRGVKRWPDLEDVLPLEEAVAIRASVDDADFDKVRATNGSTRAEAATPLQRRQRLVFRMIVEGDRNLRDSIIRRVIQEAADSNDHDFFIGLGKALSKPVENPKEPSELDLFLVNHWADQRDGLPPLCLLSGEDLTTVCRHHVGAVMNSKDDYGWVTRTRRDLKLKTIKVPKLTLSIKGNGKFSFSKTTSP
jgi:hypothetical protein